MTAKTATKTPSRTAIQRKLDYLTTLINDNRTPAAEIKAAKSARERLTAALRQVAADEPEWRWEPRWAGAKYVRGEFLSTVQIAALIRAEIKVARALGKVRPKDGEISLPDPIGEAPAGIRIGVRVPHYGSITVTVKNIPKDWGYGEYGTDIYGTPCEAPSPALYALGSALNDLASQWNYDDSDAMVDHFDTRYYLHVYDEGGHSMDFIPSCYRYQWMNDD